MFVPNGVGMSKCCLLTGVSIPTHKNHVKLIPSCLYICTLPHDGGGFRAGDVLGLDDDPGGKPRVSGRRNAHTYRGGGEVCVFS